MLYFSTSTAAPDSRGIYFNRPKYEEYKPHKCTKVVEEGCFCINCGTKADLATGNARDRQCSTNDRGIKY
jgi:hypothetical protein